MAAGTGLDVTEAGQQTPLVNTSIVRVVQPNPRDSPVRRASTVTRAPASRSSAASVMPVGPAPATSTSAFLTSPPKSLRVVNGLVVPLASGVLAHADGEFTTVGGQHLCARRTSSTSWLQNLPNTPHRILISRFFGRARTLSTASVQGSVRFPKPVSSASRIRKAHVKNT